MRLYTRVALILGLVLVTLSAAGGALWLRSARTTVHEEIEAATRVTAQWIGVLAAEIRPDSRQPPGQMHEDWLLERISAMGRIRANTLTAHSAGQLRYQSPPPRYKAGRNAPDWFVPLLAPDFNPQTIIAGNLTLTLYPDASRAVLDAWDEACQLFGAALLLIATVLLAATLALKNSLRPLEALLAALDRLGHGRFDTRLPPSGVPELSRIAHAFNGMADRLHTAIGENVALSEAREIDAAINAGMERKRHEITHAIRRELHDELAQGITAVRALAGAIAQRDSNPVVQAASQHILTATGDMQDGVRRILNRLHAPLPAADQPATGLRAALEQTAARWRCAHPDITLSLDLPGTSAPLTAQQAETVHRIVQEGLTNISRHAAARHVHLRATHSGEALHLVLDDDGRGPQPAGNSAFPGCGLGLSGMRERLAPLAGHLSLTPAPAGGTRLAVTLPITCCAHEVPA